MKFNFCSFTVGAFALTLTATSFGAAKGHKPTADHEKHDHGQLVARTELQSKSGSSVSGTVEFFQTKDGVLVEANLKNLAAGEHGFHVHEKGDCSSADAESAGGHFNPSKKPHATPGTEAHRGDFGNIVAKADKTATLSLSLKVAADEVTEYIGKAVIVHEKADDLKTQPSGNAGKRIACGVISKVPAAE